jgi:hypothetical protein
MVMYFLEGTKVETGIDDQQNADKIADLMGLKRCSL